MSEIDHINKPSLSPGLIFMDFFYDERRSIFKEKIGNLQKRLENLFSMLSKISAYLFRKKIKNKKYLQGVSVF